VIKSFENINILCKIRGRTVKSVIAFLRRVCSVRCNQIGEARHIFFTKIEQIASFPCRKTQAVPKSDKSGEYHQTQVAFGIDNEGHSFPRATRSYTPHKICLHSWETHPLRSTEVPRGLRGTPWAPRHRRGAAIDRHPRNFINRKRREAKSSRIHLPSGFIPRVL